MDTAAIYRAIGTLEGLPSVPRVYQDLLAASALPSTSVAALAAIVESDPAMAVKVLRLVNSAFFGIGKRTASIQQAIGYLGIEVIKGLALTAQMFEAAAQRPLNGFSLDDFQTYSLTVARLARAFANKPDQDTAFTAGILHDIGQLILAIKVPDTFARVLGRIAKTGEPQHVVERELLGVDHAELGAFCLATWQIPMPAIQAVAYHHSPRDMKLGHREVLAVLHAADVMVNVIKRNNTQAQLDLDFIDDVDMTDRLPAWWQLAAE